MTGIPSRGDPTRHILSALHKESFIIFIFLLGAPTRVFKLVRRGVMKSLPGREGFSQDVGGGETRGGGGMTARSVPTPFFARASSGHLDANIVLTV